MVAFIGHGDRLIVKLPRQRAVDLLDLGPAEKVTMGTRTMREWVAISAGPDRPQTLERWAPYVNEALDYSVQAR